MDFKNMKKQYQSYEEWNPNRKHQHKYENGWEESKVKDITEQLLAKTRAANARF